MDRRTHRRRRPGRDTPDNTVPSLEGDQERLFLALYLHFWRGYEPPPDDYHLVREGYEQEAIGRLPARVPPRLRRPAS